MGTGKPVGLIVNRGTRGAIPLCMTLKRLKIKDFQLSNIIHSPPHPQGLCSDENYYYVFGDTKIPVNLIIRGAYFIEIVCDDHKFFCL